MIHPSKLNYSSPFGWTHPERPLWEMCPFCKNEDTQKVRDMDRLKALSNYHEASFGAFDCFACGAEFHFTKNQT